MKTTLEIATPLLEEAKAVARNEGTTTRWKNRGLRVHHCVRELLSADRDFSRFGDLKTRNPLVTR